MELINRTRALVKELNVNGTTNNENLQKLLWNLKETTEITKEQLNEAKIHDDLGIFLTLFFTELANLYKPTKSSQFASEVMKLHNSTLSLTDKTKLSIKELQELIEKKLATLETFQQTLLEEAKQSIPSSISTNFSNARNEILEKCSEIGKQISNEQILIDEILTDWLKESRR